MSGKESEVDAQAGFVSNKEGELNGEEGPDAAATRDKLNQALIQVPRFHPHDHPPMTFCLTC